MIPVTQHSLPPGGDDVLLAALRRVLHSTWTRGEELRHFEVEFGQRLGAPHVIACNSGTQALELAYVACGVRRIYTSPISFVATAQAAWRLGIDVTFGDCDPETGLLLPARVTGGATPVPVTLGGQPLPWPTLGAIYDACHGPYEWMPGATAMCFSFHASKPIAAGEGGAVACEDPVLAARLRMLRDSGRGVAPAPKFWVQPGGTNGWWPEWSAAVARVALADADRTIVLRRAVAQRYDLALWHVLPVVEHDPRTVRHLYQVRVPAAERVALQAQLRAHNILTALHYWPLIPLQPAAALFGYRVGQWPGAEAFASQALSLPCFADLALADQEHVIATLQRYC